MGRRGRLRPGQLRQPGRGQSQSPRDQPPPLELPRHERLPFVISFVRVLNCRRIFLGLPILDLSPSLPCSSSHLELYLRHRFAWLRLELYKRITF